MEYKKISIIGAGSMGSALAKACASDPSISVTVINRTEEKLENLKKAFPGKILTSTNYESLIDSEVIILAVKPQSFTEAVEMLKDKLNKNALIISVMVGIKIDTIQEKLGVSKVVRSMPNLGAENGESMTVWTGRSLGEKDILFVKSFFNLLGEQLHVETEDFVDKATAISGSGPGFFAYIIEAYIREVEKLGFSHANATNITLQVLKATNTIIQNKKEAPGEFRSRVASKKGTTEAGLSVLMGRKLSGIFRKTLAKAYKRAKQLSKN